MKYPIAIEPGDGTHAWGVVVPDLPGCFSAADSGIDEATDNAKEAIAAWIEAVMDDGGDIPAPTSIAAHRANPEFDGWIWAVAEVDPAILDDKAERVNITLPRRVLARLDARARAAGETRSGYIAKLAIEARPIFTPGSVSR
ncbi:type II toxin-antitoxin system HicB family antitoxin [Thauera aromatica]|uniref:Phage protein n=1 Tax=Thauera aromatica K172 TaxID=44139 RepID=A0A2R4BJA2_THAAR|nr:type II toxin-antitoxin system HicB family antitoxin [Thauera aromatica]AVR87332.1 Phage protein [Thauera aromatica K172]